MAGAERTVRAVVTTYVHPDGAPRIALRGDEIEIHSDHVAAFDEGEKQVPDMREPVPYALGDEVESEYVPEEPPRTGRGSGTEAWITYARMIGLDVEDDASRDDVIDLVDSK